MHFVSFAYAALLLTTWVAYWLLPGRRARTVLLLVASYIFYMSWNPRLVVLLWFSTAVDFWAGRAIAATEDAVRRKRWLVLSLAVNLGVLGVFKYYGFFADSLIAVLEGMGVSIGDRTLHIILPLGISFYTFQSMSYSIDIYRGVLQPTRSALDFATFVAFFPQLVAGPIVRARDLLPQLRQDHAFDPEDVQSGLDRILMGLVKKSVLADNLAPFVDTIFSSPATAGTAHVWVAMVAFYGQIYWDFSAYSDIAIGSARLFGFRLRENFDLPYMSRSPQEFWRRWHVSLSTWLRDYLYIPLGGNRGTLFRLHRNLFLTMLLGGLWHGAEWPMVIWGAYQGIALGIHRWWHDGGHRLPTLAAWPLQFVVTLIGWLIFRADSAADIATLGAQLLPVGELTLAPAAIAALVFCACGFAGERLGPDFRTLCNLPGLSGPLARGVLWALAIHLLLMATPPDLQSFIYFVF